MDRPILVLLVQVDILKTIVPAGMLEPVTPHTAIRKDGLHAMIWVIWQERLLLELLVLPVIVRRIVMDM